MIERPATSHLMRLDNPANLDLYRWGGYDLNIAAERSINHSLRGNWRQSVLDEILPGTAYTPKPIIRYKAVAMVDGNYRSIYDDSPYRIGERRNGAAKPDHGGGYYCYASIASAIDAAVPQDSVNYDAPRVILECVVGGRRIQYKSGKLAYSWIEPVAVVE